jgi:hypothetical protein
MLQATYERVLSAFNRRTVSVSRSYGAPPEQEATTEWRERQARFVLLWSFWDGTAYDNLEHWATYKQEHDLVSDLRLFRSHVKQLVDFWWYHVYSGELADDGLVLPGGVQNAIPLASDTKVRLASPIGQLWQWWGWVDGMRLVMLYQAITGNCTVELVDDVRRQKVMTNILWPGYVPYMEMNSSGDVIAYAKEYEVVEPVDDRGNYETYTFRKEADKSEFRTYRNGELFDYDGFGARIPNPYGFVPAVHYRFNNTGGSWGEPAMLGSQTVIDLMNNLYTVMYGKQKTLLQAPIGVSGSMAPGAIASQIEADQAMRAGEDPLLMFPTDPVEHVNTMARNSFPVLQMSADARTVNFEVDFRQVQETIKDLNQAMNEAYPEIRFWSEIRAGERVTKPGVEAAMGDVTARHRTVSSASDRNTKKLHQMGVAIGGMRYNDGTWQKFAEANGRKLGQAHEKFKPFDLESYDNGDLNHQIMPRDLVQETDVDRLGKAERQQALGMPDPYVYQTAGISQSTMDEWVAKGWIPAFDDPTRQATGDNINAILGSIKQPVATPKAEPVPTPTNPTPATPLVGQ